jgi:hypothetical protein
MPNNVIFDKSGIIQKRIGFMSHEDIVREVENFLIKNKYDFNPCYDGYYKHFSQSRWHLVSIFTLKSSPIQVIIDAAKWHKQYNVSLLNCDDFKKYLSDDDLKKYFDWNNDEDTRKIDLGNLGDSKQPDPFYCHHEPMREMNYGPYAKNVVKI